MSLYAIIVAREETHYYIVTLGARIFGIAGDLIVLFITWHNTYTSYKAQRGVLKAPSLVQVMLYNGACVPRSEYPVLDFVS